MSLVVLVVEDNDEQRARLTEYVSDMGYVALEASQPDAALEILRSDQPVNAIVTDYGLSALKDGIDLVYSARGLRPGLPTVLISGTMSVNIPSTVTFLRKPFRAADLEKALKHALG